MTLEADLNSRAWLATLQGAGFDPQVSKASAIPCLDIGAASAAALPTRGSQSAPAVSYSIHPVDTHADACFLPSPTVWIAGRLLTYAVPAAVAAQLRRHAADASILQCASSEGCTCICVQSPTVWIAEGLLMYLEPSAVANLLEEIAGVQPYDKVAVEVCSSLAAGVRF